MKVDVYQIRKHNVCLLLPQGTKLSAMPPAVVEPWGTPRFMKTLELDAARITGECPGTIRADLLTQGFSIRQMRIRFDAPT